MAEPREPDTPALDQLVSELAEGGVVVDEGAFTLDPAAARAKLRKYRLPEPEAWVLSAVRAGARAGAKRIRYLSGNDSEMRLYGVELEPDELANLYAHALVDLDALDGTARRRSGVLRSLVAAVEAALETGATQVTLASLGRERRELGVQPQGDPQLLPSRPYSTDDPHVSLLVTRKGVMPESSLREVELLELNTQFALREIAIDHRSVPRLTVEDLPNVPGHPTEPFADDALGLQGFCTLGDRRARPGSIYFVLDDVTLGQRGLDGYLFTAAVHGDFATDLSMQELQEDARSRAARELAMRALSACNARYDPNAPKPEARNLPPDLGQQQIGVVVVLLMTVVIVLILILVLS